MPKYLVISHNTGHGTTNYHAAEAPDRDAVIRKFDDICQMTDLSDIFIDALALSDIEQHAALLKQPPTLMTAGEIVACARNHRKILRNIVPAGDPLTDMDVLYAKIGANYDAIVARIRRLGMK